MSELRDSDKSQRYIVYTVHLEGLRARMKVASENRDVLQRTLEIMESIVTSDKNAIGMAQNPSVKTVQIQLFRIAKQDLVKSKSDLERLKADIKRLTDELGRLSKEEDIVLNLRDKSVCITLRFEDYVKRQQDRQ